MEQHNASMQAGPLNSSFERKIFSADLLDAITPRSKLSNKNTNVEAEFCKKYSGIRMAGAANFVDRMDFDIYKRATKDTRLDVLIKSQQTRIGKAQQEALYGRLVEDGRRRNQIRRQLEDFGKEEAVMAKSGEKKMTEEEFEEIYSRMKRQAEERTIEVEQQRTFQETLAEMEERKVLEGSIARGKSSLL